MRRVILLSAFPLIAAFAVSIALVIGLGIARAPAQARGPEQILVLTLASDGALALVLLVLAYRLGLRPRDLGFTRPTLSVIGDAVVAAAGLWLLSIVVNLISARLFGPHPQALIETFSSHHGLAAYAMDLVASALVAPLAEESLFRGVIYGGLAQRMPLWGAAVISALLFALFHGLGVTLPIFFLGLGLAYVYARAGTIWASISTHALVNAISVTLLFAQQGF